MIETATPGATERRGSLELRAAGRRLEGYAAVFGAEARIGHFTETIRPGAFAACLAEPGWDVLALVDHDPGRLLARRSSGTLRVAEDARGLAFALEVPDTTLGRDILALAERRDLGGASFAFVAREDAWPAPDRRELRRVTLFEISVVSAWPAYEATSVVARARPPAALTPHARRLQLGCLR